MNITAKTCESLKEIEASCGNKHISAARRMCECTAPPPSCFLPVIYQEAQCDARAAIETILQFRHAVADKAVSVAAKKIIMSVCRPEHILVPHLVQPHTLRNVIAALFQVIITNAPHMLARGMMF